MPAPEGYSGLALEYWERMNPAPAQAPTFSDFEPSESPPEDNPGDAPPPDTSPALADALATAQTIMEDQEEIAASPTQGDPSHVFVSSDAEFDFWQMYGTEGILYSWKVRRGADSRDVFGTITNNGTPNRETATVQAPFRGTNSAGHVYVGTDSRGDVWQFFDGSRVLEWAVNVNDDSRNVIAGTLRDLGAPVAGPNGTIAQATASTALPNAVTPNPVPRTPPQAAAAGHVYVGTDSRGDVWQFFDGSRVLEWAVNVNDDSRNVIAGTLRDLGAPVAGPNGTIAQKPATGGPGTGGGGPNGTGAKAPPVSVAPGTTTTAGGVVGGVRPADAGPVSDPRHKYVGRDTRGDVWQLFDGSRVLEWAVKVGDASAAVLPGTYRDLGAPSAGTVAQAADLTPSAIPTTGTPAAAAETSKAAFYIGLGVVALKALVLS
jgi:hypothetical protein